MKKCVHHSLPPKFVHARSALCCFPCWSLVVEEESGKRMARDNFDWSRQLEELVEKSQRGVNWQISSYSLSVSKILFKGFCSFARTWLKSKVAIIAMLKIVHHRCELLFCQCTLVEGSFLVLDFLMQTLWTLFCACTLVGLLTPKLRWPKGDTRAFSSST